jgi:hypothetical protein
MVALDDTHAGDQTATACSSAARSSSRSRASYLSVAKRRLTMPTTLARTSDIIRKADMHQPESHVRLVPKPDIAANEKEFAALGVT